MVRNGLNSWNLCISVSVDEFLHPDFPSFFFSLSHAVVGLISPLLCQALVRHSEGAAGNKRDP
jgi:hypothetical protein